MVSTKPQVDTSGRFSIMPAIVADQPLQRQTAITERLRFVEFFRGIGDLLGFNGEQQVVSNNSNNASNATSGDAGNAKGGNDGNGGYSGSSNGSPYGANDFTDKNTETGMLGHI